MLHTSCTCYTALSESGASRAARLQVAFAIRGSFKDGYVWRVRLHLRSLPWSLTDSRRAFAIELWVQYCGGTDGQTALTFGLLGLRLLHLRLRGVG